MAITSAQFEIQNTKIINLTTVPKLSNGGVAHIECRHGSHPQDFDLINYSSTWCGRSGLCRSLLPPPNSKSNVTESQDSGILREVLQFQASPLVLKKWIMRSKQYVML